MSKELDLTVTGYGHLERGTRVIGLEHLLRLPAILGCRITDILPDSVVTDYDRARASDPRLDELIARWERMSDDERTVVLSVVRSISKK